MRAATVRLDPAMTGDAALQRIGRAGLAHVLGNEAAALAGHPEGIRQMRIAARRLRAVLSAFAGVLPKRERRWASGQLRWLGRALGPVRNRDVFAAAVLAPARRALGDIAGLDRLAAAAGRDRERAAAAAIAALQSPRYTGAMLRLTRWFDGAEWREGRGSGALAVPIAGLAAGILDRRLRAVRRRGKRLGRQSAAARHRLRIALKKLRYAADALGSLYDADAVSRYIGRLKRLQDGLGEANDVRGGRGIVAGLAAADKRHGRAIAGAGRTVLAWHRRRLRRREPKLRRDLRRLLDAAPFWTDPACEAAKTAGGGNIGAPSGVPVLSASGAGTQGNAPMLKELLGMPEGILKDLHEDHEEVSGLIDQLLKTEEAKERTPLFKEIMTKLLAHSEAEQSVLYRKMEKSEDEKGRSFAFEGENEHQIVEQQLRQMARARNKASEQWTAQATVLRELVNHHVKEEESTGFTCARQEFDSEQLDKLGEQFRRQKEKLLAEA